MAKIIVKCHPAPGFDGVFRAGRKWPASGTEIETISGDKDVEPADGKPLQVGKATLAALEGDGRFSFGVAGTIEEIESIRAENEALKARIADLESMLAGATAPSEPQAKDRGHKK